MGRGVNSYSRNSPGGEYTSPEAPKGTEVEDLEDEIMMACD